MSTKKVSKLSGGDCCVHWI